MFDTNPQIDLAFNLLQNTGVSLFLTGKAGTGKTTFLKKLKEISSKRMIIVAPTGVAAIHAGGVTIHSFFQLPFGPYLPKNPNSPIRTDSKHQFRKDKINLIRNMDILVIDEVSMVRADLLDAISDILCRYKNPHKPFGGVQLLLIGDLQQLAPVVKEDEWNLLKEQYRSTYFFESKALAESNYFCIELTKVYRQSDNHFIQMLNHIRDNQLDEETLQQLNQRYIPHFVPDDASDYITLTTHNYQAQQINNQKLTELPGEIYTFTAEIKQDFPEYAYPTEARLELKVGAQVMFIKNDTSADKRYYNGKIGRIVFINSKQITVVDRFGNEIQVDKETWENLKYTLNSETGEITETITGTFSQYPLKTAWAITIHKSQGLTFEHAIIDLSAAFSHGQAYVALSRCKSLEGVVLSSPINRNALIYDSRIESFSSFVKQRYPQEQQLNEARKQYFTELLCELFDFNPLQHRIQHLAYVVYEQLQKLYPEHSIQVSQTRDIFRSSVTEVGNRFILQLKQLISNQSLYETDQLIQERIQKGISYFLEQLNQLSQPLEQTAQLEIDNKEIKKSVLQAIEKWQEEWLVKQFTLTECQTGFSIAGYLSAQSKAFVQQLHQSTQRKRNEKSTGITKLEISTDIKHPELYEILRNWRYRLASEKGLPTYTILQQKALIGIANLLPSDSQELLKIPGIGKKVIENYGTLLLEIVDNYRVTSDSNRLPFGQ